VTAGQQVTAGPAVTCSAVALDPGDPRLAHAGRGLLAMFNAAGVLDAADVQVASRVGALAGERSEPALLALALTVRGLRHGSVCLDLTTSAEAVVGEGDELLDVSGLPWPDPDTWLATLRPGPLVADGADAPDGRPLRLVDGMLYLDRYWREEERVRHALRRLAAEPAPQVDLPRLRAGLDLLFADRQAQRQRLAAAVGVLRRVSVLAGGPGTGKTTTVAGLLRLLFDQPGPSPRVALAAPTGKAAARLEETVTAALPAEITDRLPAAATLHRLLGRGGTGGSGRLPFDVVIVDETSMVSLTMMARLLDAVRQSARLVLVGDPDQLASVEAGAVLGDLARAGGAPEPALDTGLRALELPTGVRNGVVTLDHVWRFGGAIAEFARAVQAGDADAAVGLLRAGHPDLEFAELELTGLGRTDLGISGAEPAGDRAVDAVRRDVVTAGAALVAAARAGDAGAALAALELHRVLCAHRRGPHGVTRWTTDIERWLRESVPGVSADPWYPGRPVLVTANDYDTGLFNGDMGVVLTRPEGLRVAFARGGPPSLHPPARLSDVVTVHAMTVHRGQGSQYHRVSVVLPPAESPLLSRELLYTAVTRAREHVRVVGSEAAVRAAVGRPVRRASGLRHRLAQPP
jgi:exodeoxyribonuclease V alpha subunit